MSIKERLSAPERTAKALYMIGSYKAKHPNFDDIRFVQWFFSRSAQAQRKSLDVPMLALNNRRRAMFDEPYRFCQSFTWHDYIDFPGQWDTRHRDEDISRVSLGDLGWEYETLDGKAHAVYCPYSDGMVLDMNGCKCRIIKIGVAHKHYSRDKDLGDWQWELSLSCIDAPVVDMSFRRHESYCAGLEFRETGKNAH